ncbi:MAG: PP2C family protein-serine/threonine phosphatase [Actinomycetota bacterium]|nr:PP2C family protein-serine/threonine phosphatase [Actinomycetota bacterium]
MGPPDYATALDGLADAAPVLLETLLRQAAQPLGATELTVYLVDVQHMVLQPVLLSPELQDPILAEEGVATSMAGRVFLSGEPLVADRGSEKRVWVPLVERGERTGVVALTLGSIDGQALEHCVRLGLFAGLLVRGFTPVTDLFALRRRRRPMTLAAGMQWDLLPPLTARCDRASACGRLEPAYEIAGDAFDYAINDRHLDAGIFDGMGHDVGSALLTTLAVGAYRHARRSGDGPPLVAAAIDQAVDGQYGGEAFVTAVVVRLGLDTGMLEWSNAGHPPPLLMRGHKVVSQLARPAQLPLGLGGDRSQSGREQLERGDSVLLYTDGMVEGRSAEGEEFGLERLVDQWEREALSGQPPEQTLRRLVRAVSAFNAGKLRDDATILSVTWRG